MAAIIVKKGNFTGAGNLYAAGNPGDATLDNVIRGLAVDNARLKLQVSGILDFTDNSTGTAGASLVNLVDTPALFNASSAGGASLSGLNTAIGKVKNAQKVVANALNLARTALGLVSITASEGTEAAASTIPALDKTVTSTSGTSAVSFLSYVAAAYAMKSNQRKLLRALNEVLVANGSDKVLAAFLGSVSDDFTLLAIPAGAAGLASPNSKSVAVADANTFLTDLANNYATMAAKWNAAMTQSTVGPLHVVAG